MLAFQLQQMLAVLLGVPGNQLLQQRQRQPVELHMDYSGLQQQLVGRQLFAADKGLHSTDWLGPWDCQDSGNPGVDLTLMTALQSDARKQQLTAASRRSGKDCLGVGD